MDFIAFQTETFRSDFSAATEELLPSLKTRDDESSASALEMITAMGGSIEVMARASADFQSHKQQGLKNDDITQIGDFALTLLDELSIVALNLNLQASVILLHQLSIPIALWVAEYGGKISKLDIIVNAIARYANELTDEEKLTEFCEAVRKVVFSVTDEIKMDMEATNPMRPWRILNLNWGIVATRSHNVEMMETVFEQLIKNIPADAKQFFEEGMKQMDVINYPDHVKVVMQKYNNLYTDDGKLH